MCNATVPLNRRDGHSQLYDIQHVSDLRKNGSTVKQLHLGSLYKSTKFIITEPKFYVVRELR